MYKICNCNVNVQSLRLRINNYSKYMETEQTIRDMYDENSDRTDILINYTAINNIWCCL